MRFGILGTTRAWRADAAEVPLGGPARRSLLALLLVRPGEVVGQDRLIDVLYGSRPPKNAVHALHSQVSRLRRDGVAIELTAAGYRLSVADGAVDAQRFLRLADAGRDALVPDQGSAVRAAALLREALSLWRGPAFADLDPMYGATLEERRLSAIEDRIEADLWCGEHRAVVGELGELVARHPLRERLRGQLMRALRADGRPAEALVVYEETRRLLAEELGADPSPELAGLHQSLLRGEPAVSVSVPSLPGRLTSFVGRDADVAGVTALLGRARLVTLLGPGGAGKTRLAIEIARSLRDPHKVGAAPHEAGAAPHEVGAAPHGVGAVSLETGAGPEREVVGARVGVVVLVELAAVPAGADLGRAVLGALGVRESGLMGGPPFGTQDEPPPLSRLIAALADRPALLVLDNCEHLVHDAAALAERLLSACPRLRILATTREPLGITPEHLWPVNPLSPDDAIRLFTDRAVAVRPGFTADEAVGRICATLDGLPLAIELAAARLRTHEVHELAERRGKEDRFTLLSRGSRTAEVRHRTLRAVVTWSWELLTEHEKAMAKRLTVFAGGATARGAAEVCGRADAEDLLDSLADKSLLVASGGRYHMLETIRAFCAERLADETASMRAAHARYFLDLAERADPHLRGPEQMRWLDLLTAEHDNLQAALRWAVDSGDVQLGMRLLAAQSAYLWMRGMRTSVTGAAAALLEAAGPEPDPRLGDAYALCLVAALGDSAGRDAWERHKSAAEAIVGGGEAGTRRYPIIIYLWPVVTAGSFEPRLALTVLRRAARGGDPWERAMARFIWAYPQMAAGEFAAAEADLTAALEEFRRLGDRWGAALALDGLAWLAGNHGDEDTALARTEEALTLAEQLGADEDLPDLLCNRGDHRIRRDPDGARADYERAAELAGRVGVPTYLASALRGLGDVAAREGDLGRARDLYERALRQSDPRWVKSSGNMTRLLVGLGKVAEAEGDRGKARRCYERAVESAVASGALAESARAIEALAALALADGERPSMPEGERPSMPEGECLSGLGGDGHGRRPGGGAVRAAMLLGAADAMRGGVVSGEPEVAERVRAALGEQAYVQTRRAGAQLPAGEALTLAGMPATVVAHAQHLSEHSRHLIERSWFGTATAPPGDPATVTDEGQLARPDGNGDR